MRTQREALAGEDQIDAQAVVAPVVALALIPAGVAVLVRMSHTLIWSDGFELRASGRALHAIGQPSRVWAPCDRAGDEFCRETSVDVGGSI